jgi:precorrin-6B methylase 1
MEKELEKLQGSIVCVGIGMTLGSHISPLARNYIEHADIVFSLVSDGLVEQWIEGMNKDVRSLQPYYQEGTSRIVTYRNMVQAIITEVKQGHRVVGAFYGHPGVFACVPHLVIEQAKSLGYFAQMEPGISAEDCLFADLAIDPGEYGCAQFESSQFMFYKRRVDPSAYLILWQIGIAGDTSLAKFSTGENHRKILLEILQENYALTHQVILYEAPTLAIYQPRKTVISLAELLTAKINPHTTLVIPPSKKLSINEKVLQKLNLLAKKEENSKLTIS